MGMILAHFGRHVDLDTLRRISGVSRDCVDANDLLRIASHFGLDARAVRTEPARLEKLGFPLVVFTDFIHFTLVEAVTDTQVTLNDPGFGRYRMPRQAFDESFTGIALSFTPSAAFQPDGVHVTLVRRIHRQLRNCPAVRIAAAITCGVLAPAALIPAVLTLVRQDGGTMLLWQSVIGLLVAALLGSASILMLADLEDRYRQSRLAGMAGHILRQGHSFFVYRVHAVLTQRVLSQEGVAETLFRIVLPSMSSLCVLVLCVGILMGLHAPTGIAAAIAVLASLAATYLTDRAAAELGRARQDDRDARWIKLSHSLENFESFKTSGGDREFYNDMMGLCAHSLEIRQRTAIYRSLNNIAPDATIWLLVPVALVAISLWPADTATSTFTTIAVLCLIFALFPPLRVLSGLHGTLDALRFALPPLDDLAASQAEAMEEASVPPLPPKSGSRLTLRQVAFGFSSVKPALFQDVSVDIRAGEWVALTGVSGGGKSSLAALMIGLHAPWSGCIELDGQPIGTYSRHQLSRRIGWIDKHPFFTPGTIRQNISLWDEGISQTDMDSAVRDACLHDVIANIPGGLDAALLPRASNLSGGQRQRLEIARVLARNPSLLVIDEATDGLDQVTEERLFRNLRRRGVTVLVVSHRASTIVACDRALYLANGQVHSAPPDPAIAARRAHAIANPFGQSDDSAGRPGVSAARRPDLATVFTWVAAASGIPGPLVPMDGLDRDLPALARDSRVLLRPVRFTIRSWWRRDHGPLIAFRTGSGTTNAERPIAILPDRSGGFVMVDPADNSRQRLTPDTASRLFPIAYCIYPRIKHATIRQSDFFTQPVRRVGAALRGMITAGMLLAAAPLFLPLAAHHMLSGDAGPSRLWLSGLAVWGLAMAVLLTTRIISQIRVEGIFELSAHSVLYQHLMRIQPLFIRDHPPQEVNRSLQGIPEVLALLRNGTTERLLSGVGAVTGLAAIAYLDRDLAGIALVCLLPGLLIPALIAWIRTRSALSMQRERSAGRELLAGLMQSAAKLRQSCRTEAALKTWTDHLSQERDNNNRVRRLDALSDAIIDWAFLAGPVLFLGAGFRTGLGDAGLIAAVLAFLLANLATTNAARAIVAILRTRPARQRLAFLATAPVDAAPAIPVPGPTLREAGSLDIRHLSHTYPEATAPSLLDVSLQVRPGEIIALTGPSGCGKSTLIRLILGFYPPMSGAILRNATAPDRISLTDWRETVGAVMQDDQLEMAKTIRGHIGGGDGFSLPEIREAARLALLEADLEAMPMGIQTIVDSERISTGQKQRILIARRLLRKPELLILDEATNALSDAMQAKLFDNIRMLGISCLIVSHRASALAMADRIYRMDRGRVVWVARAADAANSPDRVFPT